MQGDIFLAQMFGQRGGEGDGFRRRDCQRRRIGKHQRVAAGFQMDGRGAQPIAGIVLRGEVFGASEQWRERPILLAGDAEEVAQARIVVFALTCGEPGTGEQGLEVRCIHRTPQRSADFTRRNQVRYV